MARPVCKWFLRSELSSLRQRIRPVGSSPGQDGDPRASGPHKLPASSAIFLTRISGSPVDCQAISLPPPADIAAAVRHRPALRGRSRYAAADGRGIERLRRAAAPPRRCAPACWPAPPRRHSCGPALISPRSHAPRGVSLSRERRQSSPRTVDQQLAQIVVAALGDADQTWLAAGRDLPWHQPEPGRQITSTGESLGRCRSRRSAPLHSARRCRGSMAKPACRVIAAGALPRTHRRMRRSVDRARATRARMSSTRPRIRAAERRPSAARSWPRAAARSLRRPCGTVIPRSSSMARSWLINAVRSPTSRSRARCSVCMSSCSSALQLDKPHRRPGRRLGDRLRIAIVVLLRLDVGPDIFR